MNFYFSLLLIIISTTSMAQSLTMNISNIRNNKGQFQIAVFENNEQMKNEEPVSKLYFDKRNVKDGKLVLTIDLEPGTYGISVLDDEDRNEEMTFRLGIYPKEGIGFSNYVLSGMSKPHFDKFSFEINDDKNTNVDVTIKYF